MEVDMNFGEDIYHDGAGIVCGKDTERVVAKFSHEQEAVSFCEAVERINELEKLCAEVYQVVGTLADEAGRFGDEDVDAVLTALADQKYTVELLPFHAKGNGG